MRALGILVLATACSFTPGDVSADAGADAGADAAQDFAVAGCPGTYDVQVVSTSAQSRYRVIATEAAFAAQHAACNADHPGWTHLASFEMATELGQLRQFVGAGTFAASRKYYAGVVQQKSQAAVDAGWLVFTGSELPANQWSSGQPNDDGVPENNAENVATLNADDLLNDATGDLAYGGLCECDGMPIAATIPALLP